MLHMPTFIDEVVTITLNPQGITCAWIRPHTGSTPFYLNAYQHIPFNHAQYEHALIFNPTFIKQVITNFLVRNMLQNPFIALALEGQSIIEAVVELPQASAKAHDFHFPKLKKISWDYHYLYPTDNAHYAFYVCGMSRHVLAQHMLFCISLPGLVTHITTSTVALLHLYAYVHGAAFRRTQLKQDMELHNQDLKTFFTPDTVRRVITIPPLYAPLKQQEQLYVLTCLGLILIERNVTHGAA